DDLIARTNEHAAHDIEKHFGAIAADDAFGIERKLPANGAAQLSAGGIGITVEIAKARLRRGPCLARAAIGALIDGERNELLALGRCRQHERQPARRVEIGMGESGHADTTIASPNTSPRKARRGRGPLRSNGKVRGLLVAELDFSSRELRISWTVY